MAWADGMRQSSAAGGAATVLAAPLGGEGGFGGPGGSGGPTCSVVLERGGLWLRALQAGGGGDGGGNPVTLQVRRVVSARFVFPS